MSLILYAHPFSSYSQKVLVALYENGTPFEWREITPENPEVLAEFSALWPIKRFPLLVDVIAYRKRLLARPSFARAVDEARRYRSFFPLGAPDRD